MARPGPGCIKLLTRLRGNFCSYSLCSGRFFRTVVVFPMLFNPPSVDLFIIACKKILRNTGNGCRNFHLILSCFMQLGPGPFSIPNFLFKASSHMIANDHCDSSNRSDHMEPAPVLEAILTGRQTRLEILTVSVWKSDVK